MPQMTPEEAVLQERRRIISLLTQEPMEDPKYPRDHPYQNPFWMRVIMLNGDHLNPEELEKMLSPDRVRMDAILIRPSRGFP